MISSPNHRACHNWKNEPYTFTVVSPGPTVPVLFGSQTKTCAYVHKNDLLSFEMSMKTVEMSALINGTTPQEAYLQYLAEEEEEEEKGWYRQHVRAVSQDDESPVGRDTQGLKIGAALSQEEFNCGGETDETEDMFILEL